VKLTDADASANIGSKWTPADPPAAPQPSASDSLSDARAADPPRKRNCPHPMHEHAAPVQLASDRHFERR
jgi:hypothetical protein